MQFRNLIDVVETVLGWNVPDETLPDALRACADWRSGEHWG
jgi:hypothetical protein